jgi:hypothetical protein
VPPATAEKNASFAVTADFIVTASHAIASRPTPLPIAST